MKNVYIVTDYVMERQLAFVNLTVLCAYTGADYHYASKKFRNNKPYAIGNYVINRVKITREGDF